MANGNQNPVPPAPTIGVTPQFDPIDELRKRYPGVANETDDTILSHLTSPEKFRSAFPEYEGTSDDDIRHNMQLYWERKMRTGGLPTMPPPPSPSKIEKFATNAIPYVTGSAGGALGFGAAGPPGAVLGAVIGGAAGESTKQLVQRATGQGGEPKTSKKAAGDIAGAGLEQGAYELGGQLLGPVIKGAGKMLRPAPGEVAGVAVPAEEVGSLGRKLGLSSGEIAGETSGGAFARALQSAGEVSLAGQAVGQEAKVQTVIEANKFADHVLNGIISRQAPATGGAQVESALKIAQDAFRARGELLYGNVDQLGKDAPGNATEIIAEAKKIIGETPKPLRRTGVEGLSGGRRTGNIAVESLPESVQKAIGKASGVGTTLPQATNSQRILETMTTLKPNATFSELLASKRFLDQFLPGSTSGIADTEAQALARHFERQIYDALDSSAEHHAAETGDPSLKNAWNKARNFWRTGREVYDSEIVRGLLKKDPEDLVKSIQPGDVTQINLIKKALLGHGGKPGEFGLPEASAIAAEKYPTSVSPEKAWDVFTRQYVQTKLLQDPERQGFGLDDLIKLKDRMNTAGRSQLSAIFNTDDLGRQTLANLRLLAETGSRIKPVSSAPWRRVTELIGFFHSPAAGAEFAAGFEGGTLAITRILYSKTATKLLTRGIELSAKGSAEGVAMVERAMALAGQTDLNKLVHIETPPPPPPTGMVPLPPKM